MSGVWQGGTSLVRPAIPPGQYQEIEMIIDDSTAAKRCTFMLPTVLVDRIDALKRDVKKLDKKFDITRDIERAVNRDEKLIEKLRKAALVRAQSEGGTTTVDGDAIDTGECPNQAAI